MKGVACHAQTERHGLEGCCRYRGYITRFCTVITQNIITYSLQSFLALNTGKMLLKRGHFILFGFLAFFTAVAVGKTIDYEGCPKDDPHAKIASVDITPCSEEPCHLHKGTQVNCTVTFTPEADVTSGKLEAYGILGIKVPFPLPQPDACKDHNLVCPLKGGVENKLKISFPVKKVYPSLSLNVQFGMRDQDGKSVFCFRFKAKIVR